MRISIVSPYIYSYFNSDSGPTPGGAQRQQFLITKQLIKRGHNVSFIVGDFEQAKKEFHNGINLIKGAPTEINGPFSICGAAFRLLSAMKSANPDVFLVRGSPKLTTATYCCSKILRKPLVFRLANDSDINPDYLDSEYSTSIQWLYRQSLQDAAAVMAQTSQQHEKLKREFGVSSRVVTNAYHVPPKKEIIPQTDRNSVLWVGSSDPDQKKPQRFLNLASTISSESFEMVSKRMPDDDGYHEQLRKNAEGIPNLHFVGEVSPDAVHDYYRNAKILINTSDYEGFPNTFLEAWRYETPVVSLFFDLDETLASEEVGMISGDMAQLEQDVRLLAQDPKCRSQMGAAAREMVASHYSLANVTEEYESVFASAIG